MASILDRYGIKEVADVTFYELDSTGKPTRPVLFLDTLKVSTIEQTAEQAEARGGKGNAALIMWDYGKEINVTLEDALFSAKSMAIMFGNGTNITHGTDSTNSANLMRTEIFTASSDVDSTGLANFISSYQFYDPAGNKHDISNGIIYDETGKAVSSLTSGKKYFISYNIKVVGSIIEISANSFPGTYYVTGDTFARAEASGKDEFFQFVIPKAKVTSENTITLEAEGDPSVFNMNLRVLRPADGRMMKLVKYDLADAGTPGVSQSTFYDATHLVNG